jgi:hypothetical protein
LAASADGPTATRLATFLAQILVRLAQAEAAEEASVMQMSHLLAARAASDTPSTVKSILVKTAASLHSAMAPLLAPLEAAQEALRYRLAAAAAVLGLAAQAEQAAQETLAAAAAVAEFHDLAEHLA